MKAFSCIVTPNKKTNHTGYRKSISLFIAGLLTAGSLMATPADPFPFDPPPNFSLFIEQGRLYHPVTTSNPEAQRYFDQGLTLVYGFNHDAAYWSFQKAAKIDPELAMAYWGMALALGQNINMDITGTRSKAAYELVQKALVLSSRATDNERAYIEALAKRYSNEPNPNRPQLAADYYAAMEQVKNQFPDDLDAATLFAESGLNLNPWNQWDSEGKPRKGTLELVAVLESVLKRDPEHLGANHYYIHAIEASNYPERALMSAERLRRLLPGSGHILHMPAHIYLLVGDYHLAAACNRQAIAADRAYIKQYGMRGIYPLHYLSHNLYFLSRAYSMEGRFEDAKQAGDELYDFYAPHFESMPELEYYIPTSLFTLLRFHKWQEVTDYSPPPANMKITLILWHFAKAYAFAALGNIQQAEAQQALFLKGKDSIPPDTAFGYNKIGTVLDIADLTLQAKIAELSDSDKAIQLLQQAVAVQDQLHYNEPPDWFFPVRESLGGALLRSKKYSDAEQVFRQDLARHPRNGRALFGLLESLKGQGRQTDAFWIQRELDYAWQYSTTPLTIKNL